VSVTACIVDRRLEVMIPKVTYGLAVTVKYM
jgi:hypothetical protein